MLEILELHSNTIMKEAEDLDGHIKFLREANQYITTNVVTSTIAQDCEKEISTYSVQTLTSNTSRHQSFQKPLPTVVAKDPVASASTLLPETPVNAPVDDYRPPLPEKVPLPDKNVVDEEKMKDQALIQKQKMFPKVPKDLVTQDMEKNELLRLSCAYELVQTEVDYVRDLSTMIHVSIFRCND